MVPPWLSKHVGISDKWNLIVQIHRLKYDSQPLYRSYSILDKHPWTTFVATINFVNHQAYSYSWWLLPSLWSLTAIHCGCLPSGSPWMCWCWIQHVWWWTLMRSPLSRCLRSWASNVSRYCWGHSNWGWKHTVQGWTQDVLRGRGKLSSKSFEILNHASYM